MNLSTSIWEVSHLNQRGFIPLLVLVPLAVVATGVIGIRSGYFQGISTGFFKFLAPPSPSNLPQYLSQFQQEPKPSVTPAPTVKLIGEVQTKPFVFTPQTKTSTPSSPIFTITAPRGWIKTELGKNELVRFESTVPDTEKVKEGIITTNAIISIKGTDAYQSLDDFVDQYKASAPNAKGYQYVGSNSVKDGRSLEVRYTTNIDEKEVTVHELAYLFYKNGVSFLAKGYSSEFAWNKHSGEISSALNSFKFN